MTEHWQSFEQLQAYHFNGYRLASVFCREKGSHGGSALYCKESINFKVRYDLEKLSVSNVIECSAIQLISCSEKSIIVCIYRPDTSPLADIDLFFERLMTILNVALRENSKIVVLGDFNIDTLGRSENAQNFFDLIGSFGIEAKIREPTRITTTSSTCLDNILTNFENCESSVFEAHLSDHCGQKLRIRQLLDVPEEVFRVRQINETNLNSFNIVLSDQNWDDVLHSTEEDVNNLWNTFSERFCSLFRNNFQEKVYKSKNKLSKPKFKNSKVENLKNQLDILLVVSRIDSSYRNAYKNLKIKYDRAICEVRKAYYGDKISESNNKSKTTWNIIRHVSGKSRENGFQIVGDVSEFVEKFNEHFVTTAPNLVSKLPRSCSRELERREKSFFMFEVQKSEIYHAVKQLKNKRSCGHDQVPMSVIKHCLEFIMDPLCHIMNLSFQSGIFPDDLKVAVVKPLFKKGARDNLGNYRPISLLSSFAKVFEKVLANRFVKFFRKFDVFAGCQHGFMKGKSTETSVFELTCKIFESLEKGEVPIAIVLDLAKAFDSVNHKLLLYKLSVYGIRDKQLKLIESYLQNRKQKVVVFDGKRDHLSSERIIELGVPQGSILGPLLFVIFINDLPNIFLSDSIKSLLFADDADIIISALNIFSGIREFEDTMNRVNEWCIENQLVINNDKTQCIIFKTERANRYYPKSITYRNTVVSISECVKFLGVHIDSFMKYHSHVEEVNKKLKSVIFALRILRDQVDVDVLKTVYYAMFHSQLSYGIIFWGSSSGAHQIMRTQKSALRVIFRLGFRESCRGKFKQNNILTIYGLYIYKILMFMHKHQHYFCSHLNVNNTRRIHPFNFPVHSLSLTEKGPAYMGIKLFNSLPVNIQRLYGHGSFGKSLYCFLLHIEPYNIEEFYCSSRDNVVNI